MGLDAALFQSFSAILWGPFPSVGAGFSQPKRGVITSTCVQQTRDREVCSLKQGFSFSSVLPCGVGRASQPAHPLHVNINTCTCVRTTTTAAMVARRERGEFLPLPQGTHICPVLSCLEFRQITQELTPAAIRGRSQGEIEHGQIYISWHPGSSGRFTHKCNHTVRHWKLERGCTETRAVRFQVHLELFHRKTHTDLRMHIFQS